MSFQRVNEKGIDFYTPKHAINLDERTASICSMTGDYPSPHGPQCIQWRAEGKVKAISVASIFKTAPTGSFAQILVSSKRKNGKGERKDLTEASQFKEETTV